jgi:hypothetical protein
MALCKICSHDRREAIDRAILAGTSLRMVARTFNIARTATQRHASNHVHAADVRAEVAKARKQVLTEVAASTPAGPVQIASASDVLDELRWAYGETKQLYEIAKAASDTRLMDKAISQVGAFLEKFSRCFGMYQDGVTVNLDARTINVSGASPEFMREYIRAVRAGDPVPAFPAAHDAPAIESEIVAA